MKVMVVLAHPYEGSFCKGIKDSVIAHLEARGAEVKVKDLSRMNFNATMVTEELEAIKTHVLTEEVQKEYDDLMWSDAVVTIAPVWFGMCPGFLKAYFDKILVSGFGYNPKTGAGLMEGKRIYSVFTCGAGDPYLTVSNQFNTINYLWDNMFGMCGFSDVSTKFFQGVPYVSDEIRQYYLKQVNDYVDQIFDKKVGETGQLGFGAVLSQTAGVMSMKRREIYSKK